MRISDWSSDVCSSDLRMAEVTINGADGSYKAYVAMPKQTPAPGVLVAQEIFGVNQVMRDTCDALAPQGFLALCPDLFWRIEPGLDLTYQIPAERERDFGRFGLLVVAKGERKSLG